MSEKMNLKIKAVVDGIVAECDYNKGEWQLYRNKIEGVILTIKALGYNNKTIRYATEARTICFDLGHGKHLS